MTPDPQERLRELLARKGIRVGASAEPGPRPPGEPAPLSFAQERLWFLQRLDPASPAYHLGRTYRVRGAVDAGALGRALDALLLRHEALRTGFAADADGRPRARVAPAVPGILRGIDLGALPEPERSAAAAAHEREILAAPFALAEPPLFRALWLTLGPDEHRLTFCVHHLVFDGWSIGILARELAALYAAPAGGLAPLPLAYGDYAAWQRRRAAAPAWRESLDWWEARLRGLAPLELPADRPRPAQASGRGAGHGFAIPPRTAGPLRDLARREGTTLFAVLLAAYQALLQRHGGQEDFGVGVSVAGRTHRDLEGLVGMFVNTVVFRADLRGHPTLAGLVRRVGAEAREVLARQETPFEQIVDRLQPERDLSRNPLFQAGLFFQNTPAADLRLGSAVLEPAPADVRAAKFDLLLSLEEEPGGGLRGLAEYSTDLFEADTVARLCARYAVLLADAGSAPDQRLRDLAWLSEAETAEVVRWSDGPIREFPGAGWIHELPDRQPPGAPALAGPGGCRLAYGEFCREAERLARALRALGAGPEVLVGVCLERSVELVLALHAILRAGAAYVPLDPGYPAERLAWMAGDAGVPLVLTTRELAARLPPGRARLLCVEEPWPEGPAAGAAPDGGQAAYLIYTSGSTGRPKGAVNTHAAIRNLLRWIQSEYPLNHDDVALLKTPFSFDVSVREFFWPLACGARLAIAEPGAHRDPARLAALIREHGVTVANFVPSVFRAFLEAPGAERCTSLRRIFCTGEELPRDLVDRGREVLGAAELVNLYGPTEAAVEMTHQRCGPGSGPVPIGRPIDNLEIHVLDEALRPQPRGVPGELFLGGAGLGRGYHGRPDLTAERWVPHPRKPGRRLYRTGDLGRWRADGAVEYLGRTDFQVKLRGQRIELGEIEAVLLAHAGVREAAVVLREAQLVAYVAPRAGSVAPEELRGWLSARLPEYMIPTSWVELPALPLTVSGKTDRRALPAPPAAPPAYEPPRGEREEALAAAWTEVLRAPRVGRDDGYFALGGDSILSIRVQARVRARGWDFALADLFRHPRLGDLALALRPAPGRSPAAAAAPFSLVAPDDRARLPAGLDDAYPLTALQSGMVLHAELNPGSAVYHEVFSYELRAPWSEEAGREAMAAASRRHPLLRASFALRGYAEPLQLIHAAAPPPLAVADERGRPRAAQDEAVSGWIESELARGFRWDEPPLWRAQLLRRTDDSWQFTFSAHHAILDGWSAAALLAEFFTDYLELAAGRPAPARPPPPPFARYVALERAAAADPASGRFWSERLAGSSPGVLPRRAARPAVSGRRQASAWRTWRGPEVAALRAVAARAGVALKHVLLAAHCKVAGRYAAQRDVVAGVVTNGRPEEEGSEETLGLFLNTLPLRVGLSPGSWLDLVGAVFRAEQEAWPHRRHPLAELQKLAGRRALFETTFNYVHYHGLDALRARPGIELLAARTFDENSFAYFAQYHLDTVRDELVLELRTDAGEFTAEQAEEFAEANRAALAALAADPAARHEAAPVLPPAEFDREIRAGNAAPLPPGGPRLLSDAWRAAAERSPEAVALVDGERRLTYAELAGRVRAWAAQLRELGAGPERLVGVCLERGADLVTALLAVLESGAAYVPLDPAYPDERLAWLCADSRIGLLVSRPALAARLPRGAWAFADAAELAARPPAAAGPPSAAQLANLAYLIYTSGSTGRPKATAIEHRQACALLAWSRAAYADGELAGVLASTSVCFDLSVFEIFATLAAGGKVILAENALALPRLPARAEVTLVNTVPSAAAELVRQRALPPGLRAVNLAGEPLSAALADRIQELAPGVAVHDLYGPSEDTTYSTVARRTPGGPETIGRVLPGSRLYLLDEDFQPVPLGAAGEIFLGGAGVARGYLDRPDLTAERFLPDPYAGPGERVYRTGDLARRREDGQLEFLGRSDQQVKIRGFRIEPGEIQAVLERHPAVAEAAVVARPDAGGRPQLAAYVAGPASSSAPASELRAWVAARLPDPFVPAVFVALARLPRTPNGKLDRAALPAPAGGPAADRKDPRTPAERELARIWSEVLRVPAVGAEDDYFALGGDSILALQVAARARDAGLAVTPRLLFAHPTVAALARAAGTAAPEAAPAAADDDGSLTPIQQWFFAQDFAEPHHWNQSVLLRARAPLDPTSLERALAALGEQHAALRRRYERTPSGGWRGRPGAGPAIAFRTARLPTAAELAAACAAEQAALDFGRGPLARAVWFAGDAADPGRLFVAIHHLAVDGVSWRILLEELWAAYEAARAGRISEPASTGPGAPAWARWLREEAARGGFASERAHWTAVAGTAAAALPRDRPEGGNDVAGAKVATAALTAAETGALLRRGLAAHGCRIDDLLLAALALALRDWTGREAHRLHLEGHGRDGAGSGLDLGRTVGWFTTLYPVMLDLGGAAGAVRALGAVRAQLGAVPRRGLGYGVGRHLADPPLWPSAPAEICFNYLGQFDGWVGPEAPFAPAPEPAGPDRSPRGARPYLLEVDGLVAGGVLRFDWRYPGAVLEAATVARLADRHLGHLRALIAAAGPSGAETELDRAIAEIEL